ncbi:hypothetical protein ASPFODRAFT_53246 [Aspergillus luchuensis CBS 106.47]|uniref:Uncharacterized protein n=1 Tax=Aspergillus luchuensis (strain CBS 106.47) TaxID=1137211 RepID=A0A1M3T120_ASPLC|nr:hypothetical protein ASPFODRAFT_53246 [Aspergillus luchuensis CBS 106.47]
MSSSHSRKSQPEAAARADHSHASPNTRSRVAFNARQRAFRYPRYWTRLTLSANLAQVPPLETIHFEVLDGEALQHRADRWPEITRLRSHLDNPSQSKECVVDHDGELVPALPRLEALSSHNKSNKFALTRLAQV